MNLVLLSIIYASITCLLHDLSFINPLLKVATKVTFFSKCSCIFPCKLAYNLHSPEGKKILEFLS